jgi:hypothetical protein
MRGLAYVLILKLREQVSAWPDTQQNRDAVRAMCVRLRDSLAVRGLM